MQIVADDSSYITNVAHAKLQLQSTLIGIDIDRDMFVCPFLLHTFFIYIYSDYFKPICTEFMVN